MFISIGSSFVNTTKVIRVEFSESTLRAVVYFTDGSDSSIALPAYVKTLSDWYAWAYRTLPIASPAPRSVLMT